MRRGRTIKNTFDSSVAASKGAPLQGSSSTQQHRKQEIVQGSFKRGGRVRKSKTMPDGVEGSAPSAFSPRASAGGGSSPSPASNHSDVAMDRQLIKKMVKPGSLKRASGGRLPTAGADSGVGRLQRARLAGQKMR